MKSFFNLFSDALVSSFGWMLVHSLWQGALLVLIASVTLYLLRKSPATVRYTVGILTLSTQVISSLVTFFYYYFNATPKVLSTALKNTAHNVADWKTLTYELSLTSKVQTLADGTYPGTCDLLANWRCRFGCKISGRMDLHRISSS